MKNLVFLMMIIISGVGLILSICSEEPATIQLATVEFMLACVVATILIIAKPQES
jgi:hypothetical protein